MKSYYFNYRVKRLMYNYKIALDEYYGRKAYPIFVLFFLDFIKSIEH